MFTRRKFVSGVALGALSGAVGRKAAAGAAVETHQSMRAAQLPVIISAGNGFSYIEAAYRQLPDGADVSAAR